MLPELGAIGPFTIHSYGLAVAFGVFLATFFMTQSAKKAGFSPSEKVFDLVFVIVLSGFLGSRLFYVLMEWSWYHEHPLEIFQIWQGGLTYYGGMIASFIGFFVFVHWRHLPFFKTCDFVMPYISLAHAFGRIGCFLNGCCYGKLCPFPWAVHFPLVDGRVHPIQIYESLFNFGLFGFLVWFYPRRRFAGQITALYLILYPLGRFYLEFLRGDQPQIFVSLTLPQTMSLFFVGLGVLLYGVCRRRR